MAKKKTKRSGVRAAPRKAAAKPAVAGELEMLDAQIVRLLNRRATVAQKDHAQLQDDQTAGVGWELEKRGMEQVLAMNAGPLTDSGMRSIFREIHGATRALSQPTRVIYLGPEYSFSHLAAVERFGDSSELVPVATIPSVFEALDRKQADFGLVPIENSTDGRIADTLDMFARLPVRVCGEVQMRVHQDRMPVDLWNVHLHTVQEVRDSWGAEIPPGIDQDVGVVFTLAQHTDVSIFQQLVVDFRTWMAARGQRDRPLLITEFGVLIPPHYVDEQGHAFDAARVTAFMGQTMAWLDGQADPALGYPADNDRLVQRWNWYSLDDDSTLPGEPSLHVWNGWLFESASRDRSVFGDAFAAHTAALGPRARRQHGDRPFDRADVILAGDVLDGLMDLFAADDTADLHKVFKLHAGRRSNEVAVGLLVVDLHVAAIGPVHHVDAQGVGDDLLVGHVVAVT